MENYRLKLEKFLETYKYTPQYSTWSSILTRFLNYCERVRKEPQDFTVSDFELYLSQYSNPITIRHIKSKIQAFLNYCGIKANLPEARDVTPELDYLLSFEELKSEINKAREEQYQSFGVTPPDSSQCDNLTLGEVVLYLAWIGISRDVIAKLPLSAINLEEKHVEYNDGNTIRAFSFADYPEIVEVFIKYKNAQHFTSCRNSRNNNKQVTWVNSNYCGDFIIRTSQPSTSDSIALNIKTILNRIFKAFKSTRKYKDIYFSGAFSRGYEKIKQGNLPIFTTDGIIDYFGTVVEGETVKRSFKKQWEDYLRWRLEIEGSELKIDLESTRMTKMKTIAVKRISALDSFPEDDNTKIEVTAGELKALMVAVYNLGKSGF